MRAGSGGNVPAAHLVGPKRPQSRVRTPNVLRRWNHNSCGPQLRVAKSSCSDCGSVTKPAQPRSSANLDRASGEISPVADIPAMAASTRPSCISMSHHDIGCSATQRSSFRWITANFERVIGNRPASGIVRGGGGAKGSSEYRSTPPDRTVTLSSPAATSRSSRGLTRVSAGSSWVGSRPSALSSRICSGDSPVRRCLSGNNTATPPGAVMQDAPGRKA